MFSANENLALRQHKKRVVEYVESCIPEEALDMGTMVMAMQVSCKAPGCVPLETAIVIVFPKLGTSGSTGEEEGEELIPGLPESCGGNYKTKVLKPMSDVTKNDVLEALPPAFPGGKRSMEKLCIQARDVMLGQVTQLFAEEDQKGRQLMAQYLQQCLQEYMDRDCIPPEWGEPFPSLATSKKDDKEKADVDGGEGNNKSNTTHPTTNDNKTKATNPSPAQGGKSSSLAKGVTKTGNFVIKRPVDDDDDEPKSIKNNNKAGSISGTPGTASVSLSSLYRPSYSTNVTTPPNNNNNNKNNKHMAKGNSNNKRPPSQSIIEQLEERQHARGTRTPGCPCCDPDNTENIIDRMMGI